MTAALPEPREGRWRPLRLGLVDLFLYDAQEFRFRDGRLLIRGDNGSGKSKVLALTLPLLLDASLAPQRVEPDADAGKRMSWNLLQGGDYDERTGYSWIEFGRIDEEGEARFVTLGLGMKAVAGRDQLRSWWFTSSLRIGEGLHLGDRTKTVLTRDRLVAALGEDGRVHETKEAYRRDVDGLLFGLGEQRYAALVDLLVHLRQPQLSKRPDEKALAAALREALTPLAQDVVDDVAQAFQTLEEDRRQLEDLKASATAVRSFGTEYGAYARIAGARAADALRSVQSAVDRAQKALRESLEAQLRGAAGLADAERASDEATTEVARLRARLDELRDLRSADAFVQLEHLGLAAQAAARELAAAGEERVDAERVLERAESHASAEADAARLAAAALAETEGRIDDAARRAAVDVAVDGVRAGAERRGEQVATMRAALARRDAAAAAAADASRRTDEARSRLDTAEERERSAQTAAAAARTTWIETARSVLLRAVELRDTDEATLDALDAAAAWAEDPSGANPLLAWAAEVRQVRTAAIVQRRVAAETARDSARAAVAVLEAERRGLESRTTIEPPIPHTRSADRTGRAGAPFWRRVDFAPALDGPARAGLEAALQAAGLLDAWVGEEGPVEVAGDVVLVPAPVAGPTLADVLVPTDADPARMRAILGSIGLGFDAAAPVAVATDGRFRAGPARGSHAKPEAEFVGETARERARAARIAAIGTELDLLRAEEERSVAAVADATGRLGVLGREHASLPPDGPVRTSDARAADARDARERAATAADEVAAVAEAAVHALARARDDAAWTATDLHLPDEPAGLDAIGRAVTELLALAPLLDDRRAAAAAAQSRATTAATGVDEARMILDRRQQEESARHVARIEADERRATAESAVGAEARDLDARITEATGALVAAERTVEAAARAVRAAERVAGETDGRAREAAVVETAAVADRAVATEAFRAFASTGLLAVLDPALEVPDTGAAWAPDPAVRLARRIDTRGDDLDDAAWDRVQNRLRGAFDVLSRALSIRGREAFLETQHGVAVVRVRVGPREVTPPDLLQELEDEVGARESLLTAAEREVLENHLLDEVAASLQILMHDADRQVAAMNAELEARPTSSGLRIRIGWRPVEDTGLDSARRRLLLRTAAAWSPSDRSAIGDFLQHRIETERAADPEATWHDRLTVALDYRSWNRFVIELHQNGAWRPASGPASGGERVLAVSVPLFAAASSHYGSASPHAPRLILLDEAFAGVDDTSRANYLGLLATFDLDVVMTSEREWAAYPEVPGIAIANLTRLAGLKAVHVEHWEWDGAARSRVADPPRSAIAEPPRSAEAEDALDLFGEPV